MHCVTQPCTDDLCLLIEVSDPPPETYRKTQNSCLTEGTIDPEPYQQFNDGNCKKGPASANCLKHTGEERQRGREQHRDKGKREK